jgi:HSP20 family protein
VPCPWHDSCISGYVEGRKEVRLMELVQWRPLGELSSLQDEMDRMWNKYFGDVPFGRRSTKEWLPPLFISETGNKFVVKAELPGLEAKDVRVSISGDLLTIKGEKKEKEEQRHYVEKCYGPFQRTLYLPINVNTDTVKATFDKGVLKITLPKAQEVKKEEIDIKSK